MPRILQIDNFKFIHNFGCQKMLLKLFHNLCTNLWTSTMMLHWGHGDLEQRWSDHYVVIGCLYLHIHYGCRNCHSLMERFVCIHIRYPLRCVSKNVLQAYEYVILCESTHGINILAIQIPLTNFHRNHNIPDETIPCLTELDQLIPRFIMGVK